MATQADIRYFIAMVTGGFVPLRDLIVVGQQMGLNVKDTVEIVANLQPDLVPNNIMASMNAPAMVGDPYTAPRIGFDEAVIDYGVQEEPQTGIFQEQQQDFGPEFDYQAFQEGQFYDDPTPTSKDEKGMPGETYYSSGYGYEKPTNQTGSGSMSMSDIINSNLQASQAEAGEVGEGGITPSGPKIFPQPHGGPYRLPPPIDPVTDPAEPFISNPSRTKPRPPIQVNIEPRVRTQPTPPTPPTPVNFSYGDTQTGMMDAAATLRSPFTSGMDRQAAQDYMSGIVSNIRLPF